MTLLTILIPAFNEQDALPVLYERLKRVVAELAPDTQCEMILLDNCSTDRTGEIAKKICATDPSWRYVRYSRNFGYHASLACGFDLAKGDALVVLACDLQEPPELLPKMVELWRQGNDVVYGVLDRRHDHTILKTLGAKIFYRLFYYLSDCDIPPYATDFRIISRRVVEVVRQMREPDRYLRGLVHWVGFKQAPFTYDRAPRKHGKSTAGIWVSTLWALNAIICFSHKPLRAMSMFGMLVMAGCLLFAIYFLYIYFFPPSFIPIPPTGTTVLALLILFSIGLNSLFLGIIGEYVGRIYNQGKQRPLYVIDEAVNVLVEDMVGAPSFSRPLSR
jgi:polyisoprenyl-phosphate glycosyltransferase